jgi:hypothetical protein
VRSVGLLRLLAKGMEPLCSPVSSSFRVDNSAVGGGHLFRLLVFWPVVADLSSSSSFHRSIAKARSVSKMRPGGGTRHLLLRRIQSSAKVEGGFCSDSVRFVDEVESDGGGDYWDSSSSSSMFDLPRSIRYGVEGGLVHVENSSLRIHDAVKGNLGSGDCNRWR